MGKSCLKDDGVNCKSKSNAHIYVISTEKQANKNIYKIGKHTGSVKKLMSRYKTYYTKPPVLYYFSVTGSDEYMKRVESRILDELQPYLIQGEWVKCLLEDIVTVINKYMYNDKSKVKIEELEDEKEDEKEEEGEVEGEVEGEKEVEGEVEGEVESEEEDEKEIESEVESEDKSKVKEAEISEGKVEGKVEISEEKNREIEEEIEKKEGVEIEIYKNKEKLEVKITNPEGDMELTEVMDKIMNFIANVKKDKYNTILNIINAIECDKITFNKEQSIIKSIKNIANTDESFSNALNMEVNRTKYIELYDTQISLLEAIEYNSHTDKVLLYYSGINKYAIIEQSELPPNQNIGSTSSIGAYLSLKFNTFSKVYEILHKNNRVKVYLIIEGVVTDYEKIKEYIEEYTRVKYGIDLDKKVDYYNRSIVYYYLNDEDETHIIINYSIDSHAMLMSFVCGFGMFLRDKNEKDLARRIMASKYYDELEVNNNYYKKRTPFDASVNITEITKANVSEGLLLPYLCSVLQSYGRIPINVNVINVKNGKEKNGKEKSDNINDEIGNTSNTGSKNSFKEFIKHIIDSRPAWYNTTEYITKYTIREEFDTFCENNGLVNDIHPNRFGILINKYLMNSKGEYRDPKTKVRSIVMNDINTLFLKLKSFS